MSYDVKYFKYDTKKFYFEELVRKLFKIDKLSNVHKLVSKTSSELFSNANDDSTELHSIFYNKLNSEWLEFSSMYEEFIKTVIMDIFDVDTLVCQSKPTFRVQLPNNIAVGGNTGDSKEKYGWHKDSDEEYNHPLTEKNFIVPLTNSRDTASVYIETYPNSDKFKPAKMNVGEVFNFCGAKCVHGNKPNITGASRVSFDFRVILKEDYDEHLVRESKLTNKKFIVGEYYKLLNR